MNKTLTICISIGVVLIGLSFLINANANNSKIKQEINKQNIERLRLAEEKRSNDFKRTGCITDAEINYSSNWNLNCKTRGLKDDCNLPTITADRLTGQMNSDIDRCFKYYPTR